MKITKILCASVAKMTVKNEKTIAPDTPVRFLKGVGPARAAAFEKLSIKTVADLLEHFPRDWHFAPEAVSIKDLTENQTATVVGLVENTDLQFFKKPPYFEAYISDQSGRCRIIWFNANYLRNQITPGVRIIVWGRVNKYKNQLQFTNPKFKVLDEDDSFSPENFSGPVYPATAELTSGQIKKIIHNSLDSLIEAVPEFFDNSFLKKANLIERQTAFMWIHRPKNNLQVQQAKRRLKYDELFLMQIALAIRRYRLRHLIKAPPIICTAEIDLRIRKRFPFELTEDQNKTISEIMTDLAKEIPMNRLLQGEVGSGKTVVALYAALAAIANKKQVAIMAPTEVLAQQHFDSIERYLKASKVRRALLTGSISAAQRKEILNSIKSGNIDIVVGTVALLHRDVKFSNLALIIIDEQHKFGVHQRAQLRKNAVPHCLVMTATPIPRTLAMTVFGDLDISVIKNCPPNRGRVITKVIEPENIHNAYSFVREKLTQKQQAYFVYPRIADDENGQTKAAIAEYEKLKTQIFPDYNIALLHGQMNKKQVQKIMNDFRSGKTNILVSTVLIEVGIDIPNATVMVIEGADRFGLAQLHQLRGRIARSNQTAYCLLIAESQNETAKARLRIMERCSDGFEIAEQDLILRGPGEIFSTRQHGLPDLKIANIIEDFNLLQKARKDAFEIIESDPALSKAEHKNIKAELSRRFASSLTLVDVG